LLRSEVNELIEDSIRFIDEMGHKVPGWVRWTISDWKGQKTGTQEITDNYLGWDLTDFGSGDFNKCGLIMLTIRNGNMKHPDKYVKKYAEKLLIVREGQLTPIHFHWSKMEDIINRGGGNLVIHVWKSTGEEALSDEEVIISIDGIECHIKAGEPVILKPGQSVFFKPEVYHKFYGEPGKGKVFVGEVSSVNDDTCDNRFLDSLPRFPAIEEDEQIKYPLFSEISACF
jgi:D-lyxose ketol-isomerase